ncbi:SHOCT domain-containing protein [Companilactobacillus mishanensis]|uniref:SHOCT domain-containing protein n=1 Tax=Companilactobacillus mishanensis TaxID=2486008 RepID=A0ABW9P522_9LACO|nr:SHOCT domain-containing protein [Companilactobacillus mishanensis]MQS44350.1 SHOCT domain-containing protein [Companilactobacillus mishanensis]
MEQTLTMLLVLGFYVLIGFLIYRWHLIRKYLPQVTRNKYVMNDKRISKFALAKISKKIALKRPLTDDEKRIFKESSKLDSEEYLLQQKEKFNSVNFEATNGMPVGGATKIRQTEDQLLYFSIDYQPDPSEKYKLIEYDWSGPRYETTYTTTGTSKNKHLAPVFKHKRVSKSQTKEKTVELATLGKLVLLNVETKEKVYCEGNINSMMNSAISGFKRWPNESSAIHTVNNISLEKSLRELKSLHNDGIITSSEFEAKKKQLLGI